MKSKRVHQDQKCVNSFGDKCILLNEFDFPGTVPDVNDTDKWMKSERNPLYESLDD